MGVFINSNAIRGFVNLTCIYFLFNISGYFVYTLIDKGRYALWVTCFLLTTLTLALFRTWFEFQNVGTPIIIAWINKVAVTPKEVFKIGFFFYLLTLIPFSMGSFYYSSKRRTKMEKYLLQTELKKKEAELGMLISQLSPHFLFNTLNNIYSSTLLKKQQAPEMILKLSSLLRYVIYTIKEKNVSLDLEVEQLKNYIKLYQYRFPEELNIQLNIEGPLDHQMPPMLLLPFVENAIKHANVDGVNKDAFLHISLFSKQDCLIFNIKNSYLRQSKISNSHESGVGNLNIHNRLLMEYPKKHRLLINSSETIYEVCLEIQFD